MLVGAALVSTVASCREEVDGQGDGEGTAEAASVRAGPTRLIPTLYPSATPIASPTATATKAALPTKIPATRTDFDQVLVDLRYEIPAIGLERRLVGNVSGRVELTDLATGESVSKRDQAGVLLQIQQTLPQVDLADPEEDCQFCVLVEYELPVTAQSDSGWLQAVQLLASLENYTAANLGPHFPAGTVLGLRRSATPYYEAHTVALTSGGQLWRWRATQARINDAETGPSVDPSVFAVLESVELEDLSGAYAEACPLGSGVETLMMSLGDVERTVQIICPELALPSSFLPIYLELLSLADELISENRLEAPQFEVSPDTLVFYDRRDGIGLNILHGNRVKIDLGDEITLTTPITPSTVISLTSELELVEELDPGVTEYLRGGNDSSLLFRAEDGVYEANWVQSPPQALIPVVNELDSLIDRLSEEIGEEADQSE